jgi:hypothetical protein
MRYYLDILAHLDIFNITIATVAILHKIIELIYKYINQNIG